MVICSHDTFPSDKITARRDRTTGFWSGDVWKIETQRRSERLQTKNKSSDCMLP
jgi:hypothetical protein